MNTSRVVIILHNIRSAQNVGAIFRTADAVGVSEIVLSGYTPAPRDKFNRPNGQIMKTALGAEEAVPWRTVPHIAAVLEKLKSQGCAVFAVEQDARAKDYKAVTPEPNTVLVFGNEVEGVPQEVREYADEIIEIPMRGEKESLNVSVAAGVVLYRLFDTDSQAGAETSGVA